MVEHLLNDERTICRGFRSGSRRKQNTRQKDRRYCKKYLITPKFGRLLLVWWITIVPRTCWRAGHLRWGSAPHLASANTAARADPGTESVALHPSQPPDSTTACPISNPSRRIPSKPFLNRSVGFIPSTGLYRWQPPLRPTMEYFRQLFFWPHAHSILGVRRDIHWSAKWKLPWKKYRYILR